MTSGKILIIDDEDHIRETMAMALEAVGHRVQSAPGGAEGLQLFGSGEEWDLVLLDQRMPRMEGLEVLRQIRERDPSGRVVMVTAYGTIELAVDAMKGGAADFLRKPFTPDVLRGAVRSALARPKQTVEAADLELRRLLPRAPAAREPSDLRQIYFRTMNGYTFWPVELPDGGEETEALRVRRAFEVRSPSGEQRRCAVDVTTNVRTMVGEQTQRDIAPDHGLWTTICRSVLANHLWERAQFPPDNVLVCGLSRDQLEIVRSFVSIESERR